MHHRVLFGFGLAGLGMFAFACGGESQATPPSTAPTTTVVATTAPPPAPTTTSTGTSESAPPPPAKPSMGELQKKTLTSLWAAFNAHDVKALGAVYTADATFASPGANPKTGEGGMQEMTKDDFVHMHEGLFAGVPDVKVGAVRVFQLKDVTVTEWIGAGTNTGEMMGEKPTNKKAGFHAASVAWFNDDGLIKREVTYMDHATIAQQMGKMPGKPRPVEALPTGDPQWIQAKGDDAEAKLADWTKTASWPAVWSKHDKKAYEGIIADDSAHYDYGMPTDSIGKKALLAEYDGWAKAMPDLAFNVDNIWASGDTVVFQWTGTGTMKGSMGPLKGNGKKVTLHGLEVDQIKDAKIAKGYTYSSGTEILAQLGMLPKPKAEKKAAAAPAAGAPAAGEKKAATPTPPPAGDKK